MGKAKETEVEKIEELEEQEEKDRKSDRFFAHLEGLQDFRVTLYKHDENHKRIMIEKFVNYIPDEFTDIRDKYGVGTYTLYCHELNDGKLGKMLDSCQLNLGGLPEQVGQNPANYQPSNNFQQTLEMMASLKALMPEQNSMGNLNDVLLKMMEMNNTNIQAINSLIIKQNEKMIEFQRDTDRRTQSMIKEMSERTSPTENILSTLELIDRLKESADPEKPFYEKMLNNPMLMPLLQNVLGGTNNQALPDNPQPIKLTKSQKEDFINKFITNFPESLKTKLNKDTRKKIVGLLYQKNKSSGLTYEDFSIIVDAVMLSNQKEPEPEKQIEEVKDNALDT